MLRQTQARWRTPLMAASAAGLAMVGASAVALAKASLRYDGEAGYSSNVDQAPGGRASPYHRGDLEITGGGEGEHVGVDFTLRGSYEVFPRAENLDRRSLDATVAVRRALGKKALLTLETTAAVEDDQGVTSQTARAVVRGDVKLGAVTLSPAAQIERRAFGDYDTGLGITLPGADRDRLDVTAELAARVDLGHGWRMGPVVSVGQRTADEETDIFGRERGGRTLFTGFEAGYAGKVTASMTVGQILRRYDDPSFSDVRALSVEAEVLVPAGRNGQWTLTAATELEDDDLFIAKDVLTRVAATRYRHKLAPGVIAETGYDIEWSRYLQVGVSNRTQTVTAALEREITPRAAVRLAASHAWAGSYPEGGPVSREWRVSLGLVARMGKNGGGR